MFAKAPLIGEAARSTQIVDVSLINHFVWASEWHRQIVMANYINTHVTLIETPDNLFRNKT